MADVSRETHICSRQLESLSQFAADFWTNADNKTTARAGDRTGAGSGNPNDVSGVINDGKTPDLTNEQIAQMIKNVETGEHLKPGDKGYVEAAKPGDIDAAMQHIREGRGTVSPQVDVAVTERIEKDILGGKVDDLQTILKQQDGRPEVLAAAMQQASRDLSGAGIFLNWRPGGGPLSVYRQDGKELLAINKGSTDVNPIGAWVNGEARIYDTKTSTDRANLLREIGAYGTRQVINSDSKSSHFLPKAPGAEMPASWLRC